MPARFLVLWPRNRPTLPSNDRGFPAGKEHARRVRRRTLRARGNGDGSSQAGGSCFVDGFSSCRSVRISVLVIIRRVAASGLHGWFEPPCRRSPRRYQVRIPEDVVPVLFIFLFCVFSAKTRCDACWCYTLHGVRSHFEIAVMIPQQQHIYMVKFPCRNAHAAYPGPFLMCTCCFLRRSQLPRCR